MRHAPWIALLAVGCPADDADDPDTDAELPEFRTVADRLGGALLSITGTSATDVWTVGAEDGGSPLVLHYDGDAWTRIPTPGGGDLWWVWLPEDEPGGPVWAVGEGGRTMRLEGGDWTVHPVGDDELTLFGIWGADERQVWAVGGHIRTEGGPALYRWDGETWSAVELPELPEATRALYKVWGSGPDDVWVCGTAGAMMHWDGTSWTAVSSGTTRDLFTVHGTGPDHAFAVGGIGSATIVQWDGTAWTDVSPDFAPDFNGVSVRGDRAVAVGRTGWVWVWDGEAWTEDPRGRAALFDLHATWIDPDGGIWAVGGRLTADPLTDGVLVHAGADEVPPYAP